MAQKKSKIKVKNVKCEYRVNPLGIDHSRPRFCWQLKADERNVHQTAFQIQVTRNDDSFSTIFWDSGKQNSKQSVHIKYDGPPLSERTSYYIRVRIWDQDNNRSDWSSPVFWEMGILNTESWGAEFITYDPRQAEKKEEQACFFLRKEFSAEKNIKSARIYCSALGLYELILNGSRVGDYYFTPGWTNYNQRLQYQTYDITEMVRTGENALGVSLGPGWYKGELAWEGQQNIYGDQPAVLLQLHLIYKDGSEEIISSDETWEFSPGPIIMSEIYHGETYDARKEMAGWSEPGFDNSKWGKVNVLQEGKEKLLAQENEPVRRQEEIKPRELIKTPEGDLVLDMGQNMVGWIQFTVSGQKGDRVVLDHAEVLDQEGNFYRENIRSARQKITYILKGSESETFEPHFTFQGFRYVKIEQYPGTVELDNFRGVVLHSDMEVTGDFSCDHELINQLQHNIVWGQKGNFLDIPTDCPQRDERLGWTGDAQVFVETSIFNMETALFFRKWLHDLKSEQYEDGGVPAVIPDALDKKVSSSSGWGDAAVICPWILYKHYGDQRFLAEQYSSMKAWVEYIRDQGPEEFIWETGHHFGDWLALDSEEDSYTGATDKDYIATAFFAYSTSILKQTADILGYVEDKRKYAFLYENIKQAFKSRFVNEKGVPRIETQTAQVLALEFDLVAGEKKQQTADLLAELIREAGTQLTTGFLGTPYLCKVLTEHGYHRLALKLIKRTDYPSWLYQITRGATTIWEHWDGIKEDGSFWSADMNSFNHYAYGAVGDWLYRYVAGIRPHISNPGYGVFSIKPEISNKEEDFNHIEASFESLYGKIVSGWQKMEESIELTVKIPENTTALVRLPADSPQQVREGKKPLTTELPGVNSIQHYSADKPEEKHIILNLGSGEYYFSCPR